MVYDRQDLLELLKRDAYRTGEYVLSSGKKTNHYVNCKSVTLSGEGLALASGLMLEEVEEDSVSVAGLTLGADPLVSAVAVAAWCDERDLNALIVRKEPKGHGTASQIEGPLPPKGSKVTVLEDVVTTGGSAMKAVSVLRDAGYQVNRIVTLVDRKEYDKFFLFDNNLEIFSVYTIDDLL